MTQHRILTLSHGHPDFVKGGGEIAAYNLHNGYARQPEVEAAVFLARVDRGRGATGRIALRRPNEFLWEQGSRSVFDLKAVNQYELQGYFREFLESVRPTVVHAHHYLHFGLEIFRIIKQVDPAIRLILTLHEFIAICANEGQMIKRGSTRLCHGASLEDCARCFPERTPEDFWLRRHIIERHFDLVDQFVAPSEFLRQRYIDWGLPAGKIVVIENGQEALPKLPPRPLAPGGQRNRFAFLGQINPFKGVDLLLEALAGLPRAEREGLVLEVHGANLEYQPEPYREKMAALRRKLGASPALQWVGPYDPADMRAILAGVDWVMVPSIWWENSPMVIQEAFAAGRPVIASDIGGMAEKVTPDVDGLHVRAGNAFDWAATMQRAATEPGLWDRLYDGIRQPMSRRDCARAHLALLS